MPPNSTIWPLQAHTRGKHLVLQQYMNAWLPIMTRWNGRVLFIDAFAGPGEYSRGEPGSPIIALRALIDHKALSQMKANIHYLFIEKERDRVQHLRSVLQEYDATLPPICTYEVIKSTFDETVTQALDHVQQQNKALAPSFVMIDPFGVSDTPMNTIARILSNPKSEVYVSFMYDDINRFRAHPNFEQHLDDLFGCPDWRQGIDMEDSPHRKDFFFELYKRQLKLSGAKQVLHFELYEGRRLIYAIFFGTSNLLGSDKMKQAIWKVAPFGDYRFFGSRIGQLTFASDLKDFSPFQNDLYTEFASKGWTRVQDVVGFAMSDQTDFHSGQLKRDTLKPMEAGNLIEVKAETRKTKTSFNDEAVLRFIRPPNERMTAA